MQDRYRGHIHVRVVVNRLFPSFRDAKSVLNLVPAPGPNCSARDPVGHLAKYRPCLLPQKLLVASRMCKARKSHGYAEVDVLLEPEHVAEHGGYLSPLSGLLSQGNWTPA